MEKKYKYQFDDSTGIFYKYYYGSIQIEDILQSWENAFAKNLIPKETKGFILDYRNSHFNMNVGEHSSISAFYKNHLEIFGNLKIAILTEDPKDIVVPMLVQTEDNGYSSKPFSTLEAATDWVLS